MSIKFEAYWELLSMEISLRRKDFVAIYDRVRQTRLGARRKSTPEPAEICLAVDLASVFYFHQVLCLQRSAAAACLLKNTDSRLNL